MHQAVIEWNVSLHAGVWVGRIQNKYDKVLALKEFRT